MKTLLHWLSAALLALLLLGGIARIAVWRYQVGDVYPPLSSLRGDPLGTKVLYDALQHQQAHTVSRNHHPLQRLRQPQSDPPPSGTTLLYLGVGIQNPATDWPALTTLARSGQRVIIAFTPATSPPREKRAPKRKAKAKNDTKTDAQKKKPEEEIPTPTAVSWGDALNSLGITLHFAPEWKEKKSLQAQADQTPPLLPIEPTLPWHSILWFSSEPATHSQTLYHYESHSVMIEFPLGKGTLVLMSDPYLFSNEALSKESAPLLLTRLLIGPESSHGGGMRQLIFDESHHHIVERTGIVGLFRRYQLEGIFLVLGLIALLYIWKESMPLLPRQRPLADREETIVARHGRAGFVNFLQRHIAPARLIALCVAEWEKVFAHQHGPLTPPPTAPSQDPVAEYSKIAQSIPKNIR